MSRPTRQFVANWIICFAGFGQGEDRRTGTQILQHEIHEQCSGPGTRVLLKSWKDDVSALAMRIANWRPRDREPRITAIGYSYGGYTATLLAAALAEVGLSVENLLLVDPVWRPRATWASPLSLIRTWKIDVPPNVRHLWYWRQNAQRWCEPQGHLLRVKSIDTFWHNINAPPLPLPHRLMDDAAQVHNKALEVACPFNSQEG